jgi:hypothetical protein
MIWKEVFEDPEHPHWHVANNGALWGITHPCPHMTPDELLYDYVYTHPEPVMYCGRCDENAPDTVMALYLLGKSNIGLNNT